VLGAAAAALPAALLLALALAGCGQPASSSAKTAPTDPGAATAPATPMVAASPWQPALIFTAAQAAAVRAHIAAGDEPWATAWQAFLAEHVTAALNAPPQPLTQPYRGGGQIHQAFLQLDTDSRNARDLALAYALSGDVRYARAAHDIIVAWALHAQPTSLQDYNSPDTGQLQSWGAFSFAYAYDLTRGSGLYSSAEAAAVDAYFRRFTAALRGALDNLAADPAVGTDLRRPYEWSSSLTYLFQDRIIGGDFTLALECAVLALAHETGDQASLDWVLHGATNPLRVDIAVSSALTPDNAGDGKGTVPAPSVEILKANNEGRGGTVDYMTYNARLATLLCQVADGVGLPLTKRYQPQLGATWLYLARFFPPGAAPSPNPNDVVNASIDVPRFAPGYFAVRAPRLLSVISSGSRAEFYEPQFLGPVTLTHTPG
jgi:hypothetical protein